MKKLLLISVAFLLALSAPAVADPGLRFTPLGYCQLTTLSGSTSISTCPGWSTILSKNVNRVVITPETQAVRYRDDGTAPTATVGMPLAVGQTYVYTGTIQSLLFIEQTASAKINLVFYK